MRTLATVASQTDAWTGEGPVWCAARRCLYYVDLGDTRPGKLHVYHPERCVEEIHDLPAMTKDFTQVTAVTVVQNEPHRLAVATEAGVFLYDCQSGDLRRLTGELQPELPKGSYRSNDGKCDPRGRFLIGTMLFSADAPSGGLFSVAGSTIQRLLTGVTIGNGLAWSADGRTMYFIDSPLKRIDAFEYHLDVGTLGARRTAFDFADYFAQQAGWEEAAPDGMTIDAEGLLWVAIYGGGAALRVDPAKEEVVCRVDCPAKYTTSVALGGPARDTLYITSFRRGDAGPDAGAVFQCRAPAPGPPPAEFRL
eukprot:EG_transcript_16045